MSPILKRLSSRQIVFAFADSSIPQQTPSHKLELSPESAMNTHSLVRHLKENVHYRRRIDRLTHAQCRFEAHLVGGCHCGLVQAVTQAAHDTIHMQRSIGVEHYLQ